MLKHALVTMAFAMFINSASASEWEKHPAKEIDPDLVIPVRQGVRSIDECKQKCLDMKEYVCADRGVSCKGYPSKGWCSIFGGKLDCPVSCNRCSPGSQVHATCMGITWDFTNGDPCRLYTGSDVVQVGFVPLLGRSKSDTYIRKDAVATGAICGNGKVEAPETCDDSNTNSGDGCSSICKIEEGWSCSGASANECHRNVDCVQSAWVREGDCSYTCGGGEMQETRSILTPSEYKGRKCGPTTRTVACNTQRCTADDFPCSNVETPCPKRNIGLVWEHDTEVGGPDVIAKTAARSPDHCANQCKVNSDCEKWLFRLNKCKLLRVTAGELIETPFSKKHRIVTGRKSC